MSFTIPTGLKNIHLDVGNSLIDFGGRNVTVVYTAKREFCPNCHFNTLTNASSGKYKNGGPISFSDGICPYCMGVGFTETFSTDSIKLNVYFNPKDWTPIGIPIDIPDGIIQVRGKIADFDKVIKCDHIIINGTLDKYGTLKYKRHGEQLPGGLGLYHYFIGFWKRA